MVTIADVARHAGVAPSTVSYVLSGKRTISAATRERVEASVRALGFHRNAGARALASSRSNVLALVLPFRPESNLPVLMRFVTSVLTTARSFNHDVLLVTADEGAAGLERVAASAMADGLIVMEVELDDPRVPALGRLARPSVLIGVPADPAGLTCVDLDFAAAGAVGVDHLADLGHQTVGFLGAPRAVYERGTGFAQRTLDGFTAAARRRGLTTAWRSCEPAYDGVLASVTGLLEECPELTGLVAHNEAAVGWLLATLRALGRRVPDDMSVLAICPDEIAEHNTPPLSSVRIPAEELGREAVTLLMGKFEDRTAEAVTLLSPQLTVRGSTAGPAIPPEG